MQKVRYGKFIAAMLVYIALAVYLYLPYIKYFNRFDHLYSANVCIASIGCYILSRRWVAGFIASVLAGGLYGFGPFMLSLAKFHPTAGLLAACIPWLFLPAAYGPKDKWRWLGALLAVIPFAAIAIFFKLTAHYHLFPASRQAGLNPSDLYSLLAPLVAARRGLVSIGFYHAPVAALILGCAMLITARRIGVMAIVTAAPILVFYDDVNAALEVSPIIWLSVTMLCCSIIIGTGLQAFASAGHSDRMWILASVIIQGILAIVTLLLATQLFQTFLSLGSGYAIQFTQAAIMYILGGVAVAIIFFITCANLRMHKLREVILFVAVGLDLFLGARYIIDATF